MADPDRALLQPDVYQDWHEPAPIPEDIGAAPADHTHPDEPPLPHADTHASGGSDPLTPDAIGAAAANHEHPVVPARPPALGILDAGLATRALRPCRLVFAGSSTTFGSNATTSAARYVNILTRMIQAAYPSGLGTESNVFATATADFTGVTTAEGVHGFNVGEGGTDSSNYLNAAERTRIAAFQPRMVMHMISSNDFWLGTSPATFKANLLTVINDLKAQQTEPCVHVLVQSYERNDLESTAYTWAEYGTAMEEIAAADPDNVAYLDISEPYRLVGVPGANPFQLLDTDNLHQTNYGHALMADLLRRALGLPLVAGLNPVKTVIPPVVLASDSFNRADNTLLGSSPVGNILWEEHGSANAGIIANQLGPNSATGLGTALLDVGQADITIEATLAAVGTGVSRQGGLAIRGLDSLNTWYLSTRKDGTTEGYDLWCLQAGYGAFRVTSTPATIIPAAGQRVKVVASGTTIIGYVNGTEICRHVNAAFNQNATKAGVVFGSAGLATRWDDLVITTP